ncbi:suppressor of hpr1 [Basidiobolus ranarum]|uniref:Mediator of RNA polymerase II transcription subunit 31 n=1 Tax=Basidiobolus ranarum TaxID=34480 RepID=A0ABR2X261_9FUNG
MEPPSEQPISVPVPEELTENSTEIKPETTEETPVEIEAPIDPNKERFQVELEFIQCLANPWYLNYLAQQEYFKDAAFLNYLEYLQYWKKPEYARFIVYPHALYFLDMLQRESFREAILKQEVATFVHQRQYYHWLYFRHPPPNPEDLNAPKPEETNSTLPDANNPANNSMV